MASTYIEENLVMHITVSKELAHVTFNSDLDLETYTFKTCPDEKINGHNFIKNIICHDFNSVFKTNYTPDEFIVTSEGKNQVNNKCEYTVVYNGGKNNIICYLAVGDEMAVTIEKQ